MRCQQELHESWREARFPVEPREGRRFPRKLKNGGCCCLLASYRLLGENSTVLQLKRENTKIIHYRNLSIWLFFYQVITLNLVLEASKNNKLQRALWAYDIEGGPKCQQRSRNILQSCGKCGGIWIAYVLLCPKGSRTWVGSGPFL